MERQAPGDSGQGRLIDHPKPEGYRWVWERWHYFRDGESLCGKFKVQILGGGKPRHDWPKTLGENDRQRECANCALKLNAVEWPTGGVVE